MHRCATRRIAPSIAFVLLGACTSGDGTIQVYPDRTYQTIRAWEASAWAGNLDWTLPEIRQEVIDSSVELGINRLRVPIKSGAEQRVDQWKLWRSEDIDYDTYRCQRYATVNDNDDPNVIDWDGFQFGELDDRVESVVLPFAERLAQRGERLQINLNYVAFTGQICDGEYFHADDLAEYAEFALATHIYLRDKYGLIPDSWEMVLEPDNVDQWTPERLAKAVVLTGRVLQENGFNAKIIAPSTTSMADGLDWVRPILDDPEAKSFLWEIAYHRYRGRGSEVAAEYGQLATPEIPTAMLEWIGATYETLIEDLTVAQVSSWQQFSLGDFGPDRGGKYFLIEEPDSGQFTVRSGSRTPFLRPFFREIHTGAVRIGAEVTNPDLQVAAFTNPDGSSVVVVGHERSGLLRVDGLDDGLYKLVHVTADGSTESTTVVQGVAEVSVHGTGLMVLSRLGDAE